ncbi:adenylate kinase [Oleiagrimonas sp.]|jgi:adenylate kinase|uniref:adenylate kinase n=1 Tax=Oleiagrimonas sp. TaxID=2010330 RepID=UPI00262978C5|nr:adenylate kinase [Oleiagrimonas sp.]MDA3915111.1 adenylate kinase [Oleiagrimonas sp.]
MRIVLLGAPGSGKGTQASRLKKQLEVPHISTGDLLRAAVAAGSPLGRKAKAVMDAGQLVSDDIMLGMLEERLTQPDARNGFILDGYPRNLAQVEALDALLTRLHQPLDVVVKLNVPGEEIVGRCEIRFKAEGRADDNPEVVRKRLQVYAEQTAPVADWYQRHDMLRAVDGVGSLDEVFQRILDVLPGDRLAANG